MTARRGVVVVGGGLAGLTAAWQLEQMDASLDVVVLEATEHTGGKLRSDDIDGHLVDVGSDAFLLRVPHAQALCDELGLGADSVSPAVREALLYVGGELRPFPQGLVLGVPTDLEAVAASGLVSATGVERARQDLTMPDDRPAGGADETVGALVRRRLGNEVYEVLVEPLLSGINAGDADELSVQAGAAQLAQAVHDQPSLIEGVRRQRAAAGSSDAPIFGSLLGGTGALARALQAALRGEVRTGCTVTALERGVDEPWRVQLAGPKGDEALTADGVVLAAPAFATAPLLAPHAPHVAADLAALRYSSVAVVVATWPREAVDHPLEASGVLVPAREGLLTTACSFGTTKWPHWSDGTTVVLRASVGRIHDPRHVDLDDGELADAVLGELRAMLGLRGEPRTVQVVRWPKGLPQYEPGHLQRVDAWEVELATHAPGVVLCGASTRGLGIPAVIANARAAAELLLSAIQ